jgi:hypothetical protein
LVKAYDKVHGLLPLVKKMAAFEGWRMKTLGSEGGVRLPT